MPGARRTKGSRARSAPRGNVADDVDNLRMLLRMTRAVMSTRNSKDALEVIAEESRAALDAASFSISRWQRESGVLRTLINVGDLGPGEQRWPANEIYPLADYRLVTELLRHGRPYVTSVDDHPPDSPATSLIRSLNKESELAVPIMCHGSMWGELWATGTAGRRFGAADIELLQAIASQVSGAIGAAEIFGRISRYAYEDPLTGLANRRALDDRLRHLHTEDVPVTLLIGDIDGLKQVNDQEGHPAGDAVIRAVADVLSAVSSSVPGALVARLGGDEFCVLLPEHTLGDAERIAQDASRQLDTEGPHGVSLCWGAASGRPLPHNHQELVAAADAAMVAAKGEGPGRLRLNTHDDPVPALFSAANRRRRARRAIDDLVPRCVETLDHSACRTLEDALAILVSELRVVVSATGWTVLATAGRGEQLEIFGGLSSWQDTSAVMRLFGSTDSSYALATYPATAHAIDNGSAFVAAVDDPASDRDEGVLLQALGHNAVLCVGARHAHRGYVLKLYADRPLALHEIAPYARVLLHYCLSRFPPAPRRA